MHSAGPPVDRAGRVRVQELDGIEQLEQHASACDLCRLRRERTQVVVGSGPDRADVLVIAEAPAYHDDRSGQLLHGAVGELFDRVLELAGLTRRDVFLTSVVKCRPPTGRTPFPDEVEACGGWLFRELALVQPQVVVTLGGLPLRLVTGRFERLGDAHGSVIHASIQGRDVVVWPLYHPAAALHVPSLLGDLERDARALGQLLRGARSAPRPAVSVPAAASGADAPEPTSPSGSQDPAPSVPDAPADEPPGEPQLTFDL